MRFSLSFDMDGAAFEGGDRPESSIPQGTTRKELPCRDSAADEVAEILYRAADQIHMFGAGLEPSRTVRDSNGNTVGKWSIDDE
jgi:hypothetical protein